MKFLFVGIHYAPEPTGNGPYTRDFAEALVARGHHVTVISAQASYPYSRRLPDVSRWVWTSSVENGVRVVRCPIYLPKQFSGLGRIVHYLSFAMTSFIPILKKCLFMRPDVIINIVPTLISALFPALLAKIINSRSQIHVQDFEVEAGIATGQLASSGMVSRIAVAFGKFSLRIHDIATSISPAMVARLKEYGFRDDCCYELRNWADIDGVTPGTYSSFRELWGIRTSFVALYSGSIVKKQGISMIIDVAEILARRDDITFVICGDGSARQELIEQAKGRSNVLIKDLQPKESLGDLLNLATIHLLPQKADIADLVLPSKLTNMLASGRPSVVAASAETGLANEIRGCGLAVPPGNAAAMASAIETIIDSESMYSEMSVAARSRAEYAWAKDPIIDGYLCWLQAKLAR